MVGCLKNLPKELLVSLGSHNVDPAVHTRVLRAAVFSTRKLRVTQLIRLEPCFGVKTRRRVVLDSEARNVKTVNYVRGREHQAHRTIHGYGQSAREVVHGVFVSTAIACVPAVRVLEVPCPFLRAHTNLEGVGWWDGQVHVTSE